MLRELIKKKMDSDLNRPIPLKEDVYGPGKVGGVMGAAQPETPTNPTYYADPTLAKIMGVPR
jgi:hypothetical protein